jgi:hypothetical protein
MLKHFPFHGVHQRASSTKKINHKNSFFFFSFLFFLQQEIEQRELMELHKEKKIDLNSTKVKNHNVVVMVLKLLANNLRRTHHPQDQIDENKNKFHRFYFYC